MLRWEARHLWLKGASACLSSKQSDNICRIVFSRPWLLIWLLDDVLNLSRLRLLFSPWWNSLCISTDPRSRRLNIVIARSNAILFDSSKSNCIWTLFDKITFHILFVPKFIVMARDGRWIHDLWHRTMMAKVKLILIISYRLGDSMLITLSNECFILPWPRQQWLLEQWCLVKPLILWFEIGWVLNKLLSQSFITLIFQIVIKLHVLIYFIKSDWWGIKSRPRYLFHWITIDFTF